MPYAVVFLLEDYFAKKKKKRGSESLEVGQSADVSFSPSCDNSHCLSYFLRTFIVNLPINILVSLVLCFLKGIGVCFFCVCQSLRGTSADMVLPSSLTLLLSCMKAEVWS